ncbi:MAG: 2-C-methyl-D-erythritol 4-phosphate cytidylyltransferase [Lachnospiraceae bacterium]|nr:2-C-methyl-D-erythritol 4-phosphate cytidylyltransferase [Lachnospiraceae bacterium]
MVTGLILAGGTDINFQMNIPKQFVNVNNRPIIVYTLQNFQNHPEIDEIIISCLDGWQEMVRVYAKQFNITKLRMIITGGRDAQESTYHGLEAAREYMSKGDIIVIHDAIRPFVTERLISSSIKVCRKKGMGLAATNVMDSIIFSKDKKEGYQSLKRYELMKVQTPQSFDFEYLWDIHNRAIEQKQLGAWDNSSLLTNLGEKVYFSEGSDLNLKINTVEDVEMFKALYRMQHPEEEA